jgi:hypothetical protein
MRSYLPQTANFCSPMVPGNCAIARSIKNTKNFHPSMSCSQALFRDMPSWKSKLLYKLLQNQPSTV